jgi:hypothetical protein
MPATQIDLILLLTGLATAGALVMVLAPARTLKLLFGQSSFDTTSLLIARHWGLLIFLVGALLVYAASHAEIRGPTLIIAGIEKAAFASSVFLSPLRQYRMAFVAAVADASMAALYLIILIEL